MPLTQMLSLTAIGIPASGPIAALLDLRRALQRPFAIDLEKRVERFVQLLRGGDRKFNSLTRHRF